MNKTEFIEVFIDEFLSEIELVGECMGITLNDDILPCVMSDPKVKVVIKLMYEERQDDASNMLDDLIGTHIFDAALKYAKFAWELKE